MMLASLRPTPTLVRFFSLPVTYRSEESATPMPPNVVSTDANR
jgi:hypothetical protein